MSVAFYSKNIKDAIDKILISDRFQEKQKEQAVRIIKKLFSSKSRKASSDGEGETRIDYISDHLGIVKEEVIRIINIFREEKILANTKDLTAFGYKGENRNRSLKIVQSFNKIEKMLLALIDVEENVYHIKKLNEELSKAGIDDVSSQKIKCIIKITNYNSSNLVIPIVNDILSTDLSGTTCVLVHENEKALQIASQLIKNGVTAKLIQTNDGFELCNNYPEPSELVLQLSHRDVYLDYFINCQKAICSLHSGDQLFSCIGGLKNSKGAVVLKFSQKNLDSLNEFNKKGYYIANARVNFIVIWKKANVEKEIRIVLPEVLLKKDFHPH